MKAELRHEAMRIGGEKITRDRVIEVVNPYTRQVIGTVPKATLEDVRRAFVIAKAHHPDGVSTDFKVPKVPGYHD